MQQLMRQLFCGIHKRLDRQHEFAGHLFNEPIEPLLEFKHSESRIILWGKQSIDTVEVVTGNASFNAFHHHLVMHQSGRVELDESLIGTTRGAHHFTRMIQEHGADTVQANLKNWLTETSELGSGDDITVVMVYFAKE